MLVRTPILRGFFDQHYVIGKTPFMGAAEPLFGKLGHTQILVNSLHAPRHFWKDFLTAIDGYESPYPHPDSVLTALVGRCRRPTCFQSPLGARAGGLPSIRAGPCRHPLPAPAR